jgi:hypothetical protein
MASEILRTENFPSGIASAGLGQIERRPGDATEGESQTVSHW